MMSSLSFATRRSVQCSGESQTPLRAGSERETASSHLWRPTHCRIRGTRSPLARRWKELPPLRVLFHAQALCLLASVLGSSRFVITHLFLLTTCSSSSSSSSDAYKIKTRLGRSSRDGRFQIQNPLSISPSWNDGCVCRRPSFDLLPVILLPVTLPKEWRVNWGRRGGERPNPLRMSFRPRHGAALPALSFRTLSDRYPHEH